MKVKFMPQNIELEIEPNQSVMDLAHKNNLPVRSVCNGMASCAECRVRVLEGEQNVSHPGQKELALIGTGYFIDQRRLSCQMRCFGDVVIDLSEQVEKLKSAPKKVLGNRKMDLEKSHAVSEMLISKDGELKEIVEAAAQSKATERPQRRQSRGHGRNRNRK